MQSLVSGLFASRILFAAADGTAQSGMSPPEPVKAKGGGVVTVVKVGDIVPPRVAPPCKPGSCLFAGQSVTVIVSGSIISSSILAGKKEFEAATGAPLNINRVPFSENFEHFFSDLSSRSGKVDSSIAGAWWLGELGGADDILPAPRSLLSYGGKKYMVANDHGGQVMYYRRDLLADAQHQAAFRQKYGYALDVPKTWAQFQDVAEYFNVKNRGRLQCRLRAQSAGARLRQVKINYLPIAVGARNTQARQLLPVAKGIEIGMQIIADIGSVPAGFQIGFNLSGAVRS